MTNTERLDKLRELAAKPELAKGFPSQQACIAWANQVAPLLGFDDGLCDQFAAYQRNINTIGLSGNLQASSLNQMISILNKGIADLEHPAPKAPSMHALRPDFDNLSLTELFHTIPWRYWWGLIGLLAAAFLGGIAFAQTDLYRLFSSKMPSAQIQNSKNEVHALTHPQRNQGMAKTAIKKQ